ncbi:MAG: hypothetical protein FJX76_11880 [Armatimonadetes bacterium]|nr:hypothetical protein [Armatimonadota bacterium]
MPSHRPRFWTFLGLVIASAVVIAVFLPAIRPKAQEQRPAAPPATMDVLANIGVVDIDKLVQEHPDAQRLNDIDKQIGYIQGELEAPPDNTTIMPEVQARIVAIHKILKKELDAEVSRLEGTMHARKSAVEATLTAEGARLADEMRAFQEQLKKKYVPTASSLPAPGADEKRILQDLITARDVQMAKRKIEVERSVSDHLRGQQRDLEARLDTRMAEVMRANQAEKLQIQLDMQTSKDEESRRVLQERLAAMNRSEEETRATLRKELVGKFESEQAAEMARAQKELAAYRNKLDADVQTQLRRRLGSAGPGGGPDKDTIDRLNNELEAKQAELKSRFEARKNQLMGQLQAESHAAEQTLREKQEALRDRLKKEEQQILKEVTQKQGELNAADKKRRDHLQSELTALNEQRDKVYQGIVDQIALEVRKVADEQKVPLVLGGYRVNVDCKDLTDQTLPLVTRK